MNNETQLDLSAFDVSTGANEGFRLELQDKTGRKSGHWIEVLGRDSDEYQKLQARQQRIRLTRLQKGGMNSRLSPEELEDDAIELLAVCTKRWSFKLPDSTDYPCNAVNAQQLYKSSPLIREQVDQAVADRANFIKA